MIGLLPIDTHDRGFEQQDKEAGMEYLGRVSIGESLLDFLNTLDDEWTDILVAQIDNFFAEMAQRYGPQYECRFKDFRRHTKSDRRFIIRQLWRQTYF